MISIASGIIISSYYFTIHYEAQMISHVQEITSL